jgi:predicted Zn-dependent peptidase
MMRPSTMATAVFLLVLSAPVAPAAQPEASAESAKSAASAIPERPEQLSFEPLEFEVPAAESFRHVLDNGVVVYVAEDPSLPLVDVAVRLDIGAYLEEPGQEGLTGLTGTMLRRGGAGTLSPEDFDERADFLAAQISSFAGSTRAVASLNCITPVFDEALDLFFTMLTEPRFDEARLKVEKGNLLESMRQRNDDAGDILAREWRWLMRGFGHFTGRLATKGSLEAISPEDLAAFHAAHWQPANMRVTVSGDVETEAVLERLEEHFAAFEGKGEEAPWPPPAPNHQPEPGLYYVEKDIPQAKVFIGHLGTRWEKWDDEDNYALLVMSHILGESGFTSRITKRIRSDEGLAYSARAVYDIGELLPGSFRISFQTKSRTVALASQIALEEVRRIREELVTPLELETAKSALTETLPQRFDSVERTIAAFAEDERLGRPHEYWSAWRDRVAGVDAEDVRRVAREYLKPERMVMLMVGRWDEIRPGDEDGRASMEAFGAESAVELPLRDPLTLEPVAP